MPFLLLSPLEIGFSQPRIAPSFQDGRMIYASAKEVLARRRPGAINSYKNKKSGAARGSDRGDGAGAPGEQHILLEHPFPVIDVIR